MGLGPAGHVASPQRPSHLWSLDCTSAYFTFVAVVQHILPLLLWFSIFYLCCCVSGNGGGAGGQAVALVVDAEVTSYLMMGALSPGLKRHSVTLFEGTLCASLLTQSLPVAPLLHSCPLVTQCANRWQRHLPPNTVLMTSLVTVTVL